ncbi:phosphoethanolamine transferase [Novacetimonas pomaceti]|uniref:phosphoethanolamine transferase n=1 Tax=Novacetimonas pomaceti TaxID=2021998 RepID=UPI001C2CE070|nr:phosphoethanolamine transferase [Novacetimonas pomaceti]MBV1833738.1 phosphoethanolamine transferase [Novacetimonas pomaceti]
MNFRAYFIFIYSLFLSAAEFYISNSSVGHKHYPHHVFLIIEMFPFPFLFFNLGKIISAISNGCLLFLTIFDSFISYKCKAVTDANIIAVLGTNKNELVSMLHTVNIIVLMISVLSFCCFIYLFYIFGRFNKKIMKISSIMLFPLFMNFCYVLTQTLTNKKITRTYDIASQLRFELPGVLGDMLFAILISSHSGDPLYVTPVVRHIVRDPSITRKNGEKIHNIVFVMGESSLATHYGIYGYKAANTTPVLDKYKEQGKICVIQNSHSAADMTRSSVPMTFSFFSPKQQDTLLSEKNIIELAQDQDYKTFWISSQDGTGPYARNYGYISEFSNYVTRGDLNNTENGIRSAQDDTLLPVIKQKFADTAPYKLYVIHIYGSHQNYDDKITLQDVKELPQAITYDQSIHHTDRLIGEIMDMAKQELGDYTLIYTSDHGEIVGVGHGIQYGGYDQYNVPFLMYDPSKKYCNIAEEFEEKRGYYSSLVNKYILLSMLGYPFSEPEIEKLIPDDIILHSDSKVYDYKSIPQ